MEFRLIDYEPGTNAIRRVLEESASARISAIRHKLALAVTFCTTVEMQIQCGHMQRARTQLRKMHSITDGSARHIRGSPHIAPEILQDFEGRIVSLL